MKNTLIKSASNIFFGSTVAGVGFSFGRDIYRKIKNNVTLIIASLLLVGIIVLPFISASKSYRWYPMSKVKWFLVVLLPWASAGIASLFLLSFLFSIFIPEPKNGEELYSFWLFPISKTALLSTIMIWFVAYLLGIFYALSKRSQLKKIFNVEEYNQHFLDKHGLQEIRGGKSYTHVDQNGNRLRLVNVGLDIIEFMVVGKRNKRVFINVDDQGKFADYSGVVTI
ncbi:hypothetical protein KAJ27_08110 [bacterium]|nr:hypothetical protein [bacterium]